MGATPTPQLPVKECGTPDAIYGARVNSKGFRFDAEFPAPLIDSADRDAFIIEMHQAMLPVVERLYERMWEKVFAGKKDKEGRLYPPHYKDLWPNQQEPK